ncbi:MAG: TetR/AcrR family transcriptional regulator [Planctomycetes bacterium]|nr:TetR/AcrR family transcriptional regulator [Planctomycetota bacterium]
MTKKKTVQRERILEVAQEHFERFGYKRAVIDNIVRDVGIAKGTFYLHFKSKEQLFLEIVSQLRHEALEKFLVAMDRETTVAGKLRTMVRMSLDAFDQYPLLARLVADDPEFRLIARLLEQPSVQEEIEHSRRFVLGILEEGIANGELRADLDLETAPFVIGTMKFLHFYTGLLKFHGVQRESYVECLIDVIMRGMLQQEPVEHQSQRS